MSYLQQDTLSSVPIWVSIFKIGLNATQAQNAEKSRQSNLKAILMIENCFSSFSNVHHMKPNLEDLKRLASGKPLK